MATRKVVTNSSERVVLSRSIDNLSKAMDSFKSSVEALNEFKSGTLTEFDREIEAKKIEFKQLEEELGHARKAGEIEVDQYLQEYKRNAALQVLKELGETSITLEALAQLKKDLEESKFDREELESEITTKLEAKHERELINTTSSLQLSYKADSAADKARINQLTEHVSVLNDTILDLKSEIKSQRELTEKVAQAGKQGAITQTFGK